MMQRQRRQRRWIALLLAAGWLTAAAAAAALDPDLFLPVDPDDILILEVHVERYLASRALVGYLHGDRVLLPIGELAVVLEYAVHVDPVRGLATGWLSEESQTFNLDLANRSVTIAGQQHGLNEACIYLDDDIYVSSEELGRWWPLDLKIDLRGLRIIVMARDSIPLITRLQREATWDRHRDSTGETASYPKRPASYRLASWPFLDATVGYQADWRREAWRGSLLSRGDLARLSVTGFLGYDQHAASPWLAWLRAGRTDREAGLLGPLAATNVEVGDVTSEGLALLGNSARGRGVAITNRPLGSLSQFDVIDVHGDAPPGWDIELYLNGALHEIQSVEADGRFLFPGVPLRLGLNIVRTVQYGPSGQVREQVRTYNIQSGMWRRGQFSYSYSSLQLGESILGSASGLDASPEQGKWNHQLDLGYGLGPLTTLGLAAVRTHEGDQQREYLQARVLQSLYGVFLQAAAARELSGGTAGNLSVQARIGRQALYLNYARFDDFGDQGPVGRSHLRRRAEARLSGALNPDSRQRVSYRLGWQVDRAHEEFELDRSALSLNLGTNLRQISLGHELVYLNESGVLDRDLILGRWLLAGYLRGLRIRGDVDYDLSGVDGLRAFGLGLNRAFHHNLTLQITGRRSYVGQTASTVQGSLDWHQRWLRFGLRLGYDDPGGASIGFAATTSLAKAPMGAGVQLSSQRLTSHGAATIRAFIDHDGDGAYSPGDEPLPGVGFLRHPLWRGLHTDADGQAFLPGIPANQFTNVLIDMSSVDDPFLVPLNEGMTTVVHPGGVASLLFPFHYVGEIEGYVLLDPDLQRPLRNIGLELLDDEDRRVAEAVSEFDGNYLIQNVRPGRYRLRVVESTLRGRPYAVPEPQWIEIPPGGDYVQGPTLVLHDASSDLPLIAALPAASQPAASEDAVPSADPASVDQPRPGPKPAPISPAQPPGPDDTAATVVMDTPPSAPTAPRTPVPAVEPAAVPTTPAPVVSAAPPRQASPAVAAELSPATVRTLHLLYELLHDSQLFARD